MLRDSVDDSYESKARAKLNFILSIDPRSLVVDEHRRATRSGKYGRIDQELAPAFKI
jgi:hypothetical protein